MMLSRRSFTACFTAFLLAGSHIPALSEQISDQFSPEITIARQAKDNQKSVFSKNWMISAANPHAVEAGARILRGGGNAIDAAIAVQLTLGLVEPQSSGLGGGAFLVYYDAKSGEVTTLDGRETAPAAATPELFQDENGNPLKFFDAVVGGRSVGTPGTPALLWDMSQRWGQRNWSSLFEYSINLASTGFTVSPRLAALLERAKDTLSKQKYASDLFLPDGVPLKAGTKFINNDFLIVF